MKKNYRTIHYSQLKYERTSPYKKGRVPRIWLRNELSYRGFFKDLLKDIWKFFKFIKRLYRKELVIGSILVLALAPEPHHVKAEIPVKPSYMHPVERLQPVEAISIPVPGEVSPTPEPQPVVAPPAPVAVNNAPSNCGDNFYANFIYSHESGCDTNRYNSIGCYGIGQSCPASKIAQCGADYACQNAWFTDYANRAYGGWANAYAFWLQNHWW